MLCELRSFQDSQRHAAAIAGWQQVYDQLGAGRPSSELLQVSGERFQVFHEVLDKRVVQHGQSPRKRFCMAFSTARTPVIQGCKVVSNSVLLLRDGEEFMLHAPEGLAFLALCVDLERFSRLAEVELGTERFARFAAMPGMDVPMRLLKAISVRLFRDLDGLVARGSHDDPVLEKRIEDTLMAVLLDLFLQANGEKRRNELAVSTYLVKRSQELALADPQRPLSVLDLCEQLHVSRKTLQNSFQRVVSMRPVEFLRSIRLNAVRRQLMASSADESSVGDVAYAMGFRHLSHFSASYYTLFGEYPSETPRSD
ncbi:MULTISPECIES: helix-turn-helix domain-containing protein [unclassified Modicisalibacter]|uniref:helix-turn-helix domain-containing protein n=1 Tax=unclassified Modicisalibacter TaxID=2679913 RepID=UPI001CD01602|nr:MULTISPECIES: helix-turn-helix domain-containing protein [unclassified Modicisalibacter]MBZ9558543.1 helix-turn-helix domain-containing protein [Modicisalibacter sp. R2A 31.J]MBZ9575565.1 helix-turn-helix domain-containing protein [Modicisalibacter sp. MOD 31.J]